MITYRRNKFGREYFRIDGIQYTRVLNKEYGSVAEQWESNTRCSNVLQDNLYIPCTEAEFTSAYKEAFDRIALMKIV